MIRFALLHAIAFLLAGAAFWTALRRPKPSLAMLARLICVFMPLAYLVLQYRKQIALRNYADMSVWLELAYRVSIGEGLRSTIEGGMHPGWYDWLGTHFTPLMYVFGWAYRVFPAPETLIVLQAFLLAAAVYAARRLARAAGLASEESDCAAGVFALYPTYGYISLYEFESLRFCIPFLLMALSFRLERRVGLFAAFLALAALCREEVSLTIFAYGVILALCRETRRLGAVVALSAAAAFMTITRVLMPAYQPEGAWHVNTQWFAAFGDGYAGIIFGAITRPLLFMKTILAPVKIGSVATMLGGFAFLPLASVVAAPAAVCLLIGMMSASPTHGSYFLYYVSPAVPFLYYGFIEGAGRAAGAFGRPGKVGRTEFVRATFIAALVIHAALGPSPLSLQYWLRGYALAPFNTLNFHRSSYRVEASDDAARRMAARVPADASISAEQHLLPLVYDRREVFVFPDIERAEYAFIDRVNMYKAGIGVVAGSWEGMRSRPEAYYDCLSGRGDQWSLIASDSGVELYRRVRAHAEPCVPLR